MSIDTTPPQLVSISMPEVIDLGDGNVAATFSVTAVDNVGMDSALFWFDSPVGYGFSATSTPGSWSLMIISGEWEENQASVTRYFAQDHSANTPRTVSLNRIEIDDVNGNSRTYQRADLEAMGLQTSFELWRGGPPEPDLGFRSEREGNTLVVRIVNEGDAREDATLSGQIAFSLDGASFVSGAALGTSTFNSSMSQIGGEIQINFNSSLAGLKPTGTPLVEFAFDLSQTGSISIVNNSMMLDGRSANVTPPEQVSFEILMAQVQGVVLNHAGDALEGATVTFVPDNAPAQDAFTSGDGSFGFEIRQGLSGYLHASRDYNPATDNVITARDALDVLRLAVGIAPSWGDANPLNFIAADINQDGMVTAADALEVLRAAVGLQSSAQPRWVFFDSDADLAGVDRGNTEFQNGLVINPLVVELAEISMVGVLLGSMQEYV